MNVCGVIQNRHGHPKMNELRRPPHEFGVSWGVGGFRVGRSQYGTWWISLSLPFGVRISRRLGRERAPSAGLEGKATPPATEAQLQNPPREEASNPKTHNQQVLEAIHRKRPL